ncbi:MAG: hypothetical protein IH616_14015 [Gemmatimonadales bacterium]|nr:hypothetical protein [Gemmatimonadales bacterium]
MTRGPNPQAVGKVAAEHLGPILYALETCAVTMEHAEREEEAAYYRGLARLLADAGGRDPGAADDGEPAAP